MKTTTYICDVCKKSVSQNDLKQIKISAQFRKPNSSGYSPQHTIGKDICIHCLSERGLTSEVKNTKELQDKEDVKLEHRLQNVFIEFLEDLGVQFEE